jgi:hypothetical protein
MRALLALMSLGCAAQYDPLKPLTDDVLILSKARLAVQRMSTKMPDYTCTETIERSHRPASSKRFNLIDTIRLEVALVDKKELFSWPGAARFETSDLKDLVKGGAIGNGDFALHARSIFLSGAAQFTYAGVEEIGGRKMHRFDYRVPRAFSGYTVRLEPHQGIVGYFGSVWNDAGNYDLRQIEINVDEIPPHLPLRSSFSRIEYQRVPIGSGEFVLPKASELVMVDTNGNESRNRATFSECRQFTGESSLVFEDPPAETQAAPAAETITLPEGLDVSVKVNHAVDVKKAAVGDQVKMTVTKDAKRKGQVLVPRGAVIESRVFKSWCEPPPGGYCVVVMRPERFSFGNKSGAFAANLTSPSLDLLFAASAPNRRVRYELELRLQGMPADTGAVYLRGVTTLASGYPLVWRTLESPGGEKQ